MQQERGSFPPDQKSHPDATVLTRRDLLKRGIALGISTPVVVVLLNDSVGNNASTEETDKNNQTEPALQGPELVREDPLFVHEQNATPTVLLNPKP